MDFQPRRTALLFGASLILILLALIWSALPPWGSWEPEQILELSRSWGHSWPVLLGFLFLYAFGNFFFLPIPLITLAASALFPLWKAVPCGLLGSLGAASLGYLLGRYLDVARWPQYWQRQALRVRQSISAREIWAIVLLRLAPTPPFTVTSLLAGSCRIPFRAYALGSVLGVSPQIILFNIFGSQLIELMQRPQTSAVLALGVALAFYSLLQKRPREKQRLSSRRSPEPTPADAVQP